MVTIRCAVCGAAVTQNAPRRAQDVLKRCQARSAKHERSEGRRALQRKASRLDEAPRE